MKMIESEMFNSLDSHLVEKIREIINDLRYWEVYTTNFDQEGNQTKIRKLKVPRDLINTGEVHLYAWITEVGEDLEKKIEDWCRNATNSGLFYIRIRSESSAPKGKEAFAISFISN